MSDKILLQNMMFYGFHGVYEHEREIGQRFYVDVELELDISKAAETDNLNDTLNYISIYEQVRLVMENKKFTLLEALAGHIAKSLLSTDGITRTTVRVRKPCVPLPGQLDYVQLEVTRSR